MTLRESDIIPGRDYLCRVDGHLCALFWVDDAWYAGDQPVTGDVEVLREIDLEALAAGAEIGDPPCLHSSWEERGGGSRRCADCREWLPPLEERPASGDATAKAEVGWTDEMRQAERERYDDERAMRDAYRLGRWR